LHLVRGATNAPRKRWCSSIARDRRLKDARGFTGSQEFAELLPLIGSVNSRRVELVERFEAILDAEPPAVPCNHGNSGHEPLGRK
jgi:hypothetical protein